MGSRQHRQSIPRRILHRTMWWLVFLGSILTQRAIQINKNLEGFVPISTPRFLASFKRKFCARRRTSVSVTFYSQLASVQYAIGNSKILSYESSFANRF